MSVNGLMPFSEIIKHFSEQHLNWSLLLFFKAQMVALASAAGWLQGILLCSQEHSSCSFPLYFLITQPWRKTVNLVCVLGWQPVCNESMRVYSPNNIYDGKLLDLAGQIFLCLFFLCRDAVKKLALIKSLAICQDA